MNQLKKQGLIRRVDNIGRIILPKELRELLSIHEEEAVEISLMGHGIYIEKYQPLQTLDSLCEQYLSVLAKNCTVKTVICSTNHVIASRGITFSGNLLLSEKLQKIINNFEEYQYSEGSPVSLFSTGKYPVHNVYPLGKKEAPLGAVILLHYRSTTATEKANAKLIADLLTSQLINQ